VAEIDSSITDMKAFASFYKGWLADRHLELTLRLGRVTFSTNPTMPRLLSSLEPDRWRTFSKWQLSSRHSLLAALKIKCSPQTFCDVHGGVVPIVHIEPFNYFQPPSDLHGNDSKALVQFQLNACTALFGECQEHVNSSLRGTGIRTPFWEEG
jgi:hypothetical protein